MLSSALQRGLDNWWVIEGHAIWAALREVADGEEVEAVFADLLHETDTESYEVRRTPLEDVQAARRNTTRLPLQSAVLSDEVKQRIAEDHGPNLPA